MKGMILMSDIITEDKAYKIVEEFLEEILSEDRDIIALYVIGSLGGGYYRPGQSDIDTIIIVRDDTFITQKQIDEIADKYHRKYDIPKGFGSVLIRISELSPPYLKSEIDEFEFTIEIARLKTQGKAIYGLIEIEDIKMPSKKDFIKDALIMEHWFDKEFGYPIFDKLQITGCVNCILGYIRRYLIIEKNIFEFNKFKTIDIYLQNNPPILNNRAFEFINYKLNNKTNDTQEDLYMLRACGIDFRDFFNTRLLGVNKYSL